MNADSITTSTSEGSVEETTSPRPRTRRRARTLGLCALLALGLTVTTLAGTAQSASAWSGSPVYTPGSVTLPAPQMRDVSIGGVLNATFSIGGPTVSRSPAFSGAQDVHVNYQVQFWANNTWNTVAQTVKSARIAQGSTRAIVPGTSLTPDSMKGYYRVVEVIVWYKAGTTSLLGGMVVEPTAASDLQCATGSRPCAAYAGYLRYGRLYAFGGGW